MLFYSVPYGSNPIHSRSFAIVSAPSACQINLAVSEIIGCLLIGKKVAKERLRSPSLNQYYKCVKALTPPFCMAFDLWSKPLKSCKFAVIQCSQGQFHSKNSIWMKNNNVTFESE